MPHNRRHRPRRPIQPGMRSPGLTTAMVQPGYSPFPQFPAVNPRGQMMLSPEIAVLMAAAAQNMRRFM